MCLPLPYRVAEILEDGSARVTLGESSEIVSLELVDDVCVGDHLILHGKFALTKLADDEAQELLVQLEEAGA